MGKEKSSYIKHALQKYREARMIFMNLRTDESLAELRKAKRNNGGK